MITRFSSGLLCLILLLVFFVEISVHGQNWPMINFDKERTSWASNETILYPPLDQIDEILVKSPGDYISVNHLTFYNDLLAISVGRYPNILEVVNTTSGDTLWTFEILESGGSMNYVCAQNDSMIFAGGQQGLG